MMQEGRADVKGGVESAALAAPSAFAPDFSINYMDSSMLEVGRSDDTLGRFLFRRDGVFTWKLTSIEVPI